MCRWYPILNQVELHIDLHGSRTDPRRNESHIMALLDWTLVVFGAVIAFSGGWIQFHPERLYPRQSRTYWHDASALEQIRTLGGCFLFMGCFFAVQMTTNLVR